MKLKILAKLRFSFVLFLTGFTLSVFAQTGTVKGKVSDGQGNPVTGASVLVVGTTTGTITDINGNYSLQIPQGNVKISFNFIGFLNETVEIDLKGGTEIEQNIIMVEDLQNLDEVVVIGYGTQKRSDLTGAVASVNSEDLLKAPTTNIEQSLIGRVAGVQVSKATGAPGADSKVRIRGVITFGDAEPLYIIDGVPGSSAEVNPADIESMEILKDASTTAIYGSDGANGVVLITTKKGKQGKVDVTFNAYQGIQKVYKTMDMANTEQIANYINEAEIIKGTRIARRTFPDISVISSLPDFDHQSALFRDAKVQNYDLGVASGNEKSSVYFGLGYYDQDGIVKNTSYKKINFRLNSDFKVREWFTLGENVTFYTQNTKGFNEWQLKNEYHTPFMHAAAFMPFDSLQITDENGDKVYSGDRFGNNNPMATVDYLSDNTWLNYSGKASVWTRISPVKGLSFESRLSGNLGFNDDNSFTPIYNVVNSIQNSARTSIKRNMRKDMGWNFQNFLTYSTSIKESFNISAMAGMEAGYYFYHWIEGTRYDLINSSEEMRYFNASQEPDSTEVAPTGTGAESSGYAYFGRLSFDYKNKYLIQANIRRDGSSKFGPDKRFGVFPSFSVGWKFTEEDFMKSIPWLNFGKIRYGWGQAGSNNVSDYDYYSTVLLNENFDAILNNSNSILTGAAPSKLVNRSIAWETVLTSSLGLDLQFVNNKLGFSIDYFTRKNIGMLMKVPIPDLAGWKVMQEYQEGGSATAYSNAGTLKNSGIEFSLSWKETVNSKFSYDVSGNFTYLKNEVIDIGGDTLLSSDATIRGLDGYLTSTYEGGGIGDFYGMKIDRLFQESDGYYDETLEKWVLTNQPYITGTDGNPVYAQSDAQPGDYKWKDLNGNGRIDKGDKTTLGNPQPKYVLGFNASARYGIFDVSMFWQGAFGLDILNGTYACLIGQGASGTLNLPTDFIEDHYRPANDKYDYPAVTSAKWARYDPFNKNSNFNTLSDVYIESGNYIRLKNLQIGVNLPNAWLEKAKIASFRIYVGFDNLLTFTKYSGMDPEIDSRNPIAAGIDKAIYPSARTNQVGINLKF